MYANHYAKRVANNNPWKILPKRDFLTLLSMFLIQTFFEFTV